jgi:hypothetical protein
MSRSKGSKNPARANQRRAAQPVYFTLAQADRMMPLVAHIADEVHNRWQRLSILEKEQTDLDRRRLKLEWSERSRRYQVADDINNERQKLQEAIAELEHLQVILVDPVEGEMAFPTVVQGRKAYYVWRMGLPEVAWWCYANEPNRRTIPASWRKKKEAKESIEE